MKITLYQVDAFTSKLFGGNPAAVCPLEKWIDEKMMQAIALENNLSETAFIVAEKENTFGIRWFTPTVEVDLCGHATLGAAYVVFHYLHQEWNKVTFNSRSGPLHVTRDNTLLTLDFPAIKGEKITSSANWQALLGVKPLEVYQGKDCLVLLDSEETVANLKVDMAGIAQLETRALIVTAKGNNVDFVSRFFAPRVGVPEDPVTGSAHSMLIPFWANRLGKKQLVAKQLSARGGELFCEQQQDRVMIGGHAVLYMQGEIHL